MAKLGTKEKYHAMTRDLMWDPKHFDMNKVYPLIEKEGIILKDPSKWEDPFRMTYNQYVKIQSEKDGIFHAVQMLLKQMTDMLKWSIRAGMKG